MFVFQAAQSYSNQLVAAQSPMPGTTTSIYYPNPSVQPVTPSAPVTPMTPLSAEASGIVPQLQYVDIFPYWFGCLDFLLILDRVSPLLTPLI